MGHESSIFSAKPSALAEMRTKAPLLQRIFYLKYTSSNGAIEVKEFLHLLSDAGLSDLTLEDCRQIFVRSYSTMEGNDNERKCGDEQPGLAFFEFIEALARVAGGADKDAFLAHKIEILLAALTALFRN